MTNCLHNCLDDQIWWIIFVREHTTRLQFWRPATAEICRPHIMVEFARSDRCLRCSPNLVPSPCRHPKRKTDSRTWIFRQQIILMICLCHNLWVPQHQPLPWQRMLSSSENKKNYTIEERGFSQLWSISRDDIVT